MVHEYGGQVLVGVVGDAGGGDGLDKLGQWKAGSQSVHVLIYQITQWDTLKEKKAWVKGNPTYINYAVPVCTSAGLQRCLHQPCSPPEHSPQQ